MTVVSGRSIKAGLVWSIISSILGNAVLHDDEMPRYYLRIASSILRFRQY